MTLLSLILSSRLLAVELVLFCNLSDLQRQMYRRLISGPSMTSCMSSGDPGQHLMCISALKKLCNHPILLHRTALNSGGGDGGTSGGVDGVEGQDDTKVRKSRDGVE